MSNAREARLMLREHRYGVLSTSSKKFDGYPFGSITPYLTDHDGSLLILISSLAEHTKNIQHDTRVSLITHDQRDPHIQTQGRVTVVGDAQQEPDRDGAGKRYLGYFPEAQTYLGMHDFTFYRIHPKAIRYVGGFGKINWVNMENFNLQPSQLVAQEAEVVAHMNSDHQDVLRNCCLHFHQYDAVTVAMIGIDQDGFDVRADDRVLRFNFPRLAADEQLARALLLEMAQEARK